MGMKENKQDDTKNELKKEDKAVIDKSSTAGELVPDEMVMGIYGEILENIRKDRSEADEILSNFVNMVINEGDASNSSKEALVSLVKIKSDASDKMAKIADLMTRIKLKERNTMPDWQKAKSNTINIIDQGGQSRRSIIDEALEKERKKS